MHALEISKFFGDRLDREMLEIYSALRHRPDGGVLVLCTIALAGRRHRARNPAAEQAEFEASCPLERSCRTSP